VREYFRHFARRVSDFSASPVASALALALIVAWVASGPKLHFSDTWQLIMNTTSSLVTFLMVFIIANAQKRDTDALNLKLDMLIAANADLSNRAVGIEAASEAETLQVRREIEEALAESDATGPPLRDIIRERKG
jgi:low affinity Fe/Cu permease